jgi:hypothetical protein
MTIHAIAGLALLNALFLALGGSVLWTLRGWETWLEISRFAGLAYLLGVAVFGSVWTLLLVLGVPFGFVSIVVSVVLLAGSSLAVGIGVGRRRPALGALGTVGAMSLVGALGVAATGYFLEVLFRAGRLQGLFAWDAWSFWVPKAKAIYFFGGLDHQMFTTLPGTNYPPLVPIIDAAAFHFMGSADTVTLDLQFWFLTVGFVAAAAGILSTRVPSWILWPFLALLLVAPRVSGHLLTPQADFLLDFFVAIAALLVCVWLRERTTWLLASATLLLCGAVLTKREGLLLATCIYVSAVLASCLHWRRAWPSLLASGLVVGAATLPWRLWNVRNAGGGGAPLGEAGGVVSGGGGLDTDRAVSALRLSVDVVFDTSLWSLLPVVVCGALVLSLIWGRRSEAVFVGALCLFAVIGGAWITTVVTTFPVVATESVNPIVRYTAAIVLMAACTAPVLLAGVWSARSEADAG